MAGIRESKAHETFQYQTEPAIVAHACQDALGQIGKVTDVSRETGTIVGKIDLGFFNPAKAIIRISKQSDLTELSIQTNRDEGLLSGDGAQKALTIFAQKMGEDKRLSGKSTGGW